MTRTIKPGPQNPSPRSSRLEAQQHLLRHLDAWLVRRDVKKRTLAAQLEISESVLSRYLSGDTVMPLGALAQIAAFLNVPPSALLSPPPAKELGPLFEETCTEMARIGPDHWGKLLEIARVVYSAET